MSSLPTVDRDLSTKNSGSWRIAVFAVLTIGFLADVTWLWNDAVVPWDSKNHFYPMFRFLGEQMSSGAVPLWNPYHFSGHPTAADPQSLLFSPTMLALAYFAPRASMQLFDAAIMAHLTFGGLGILLLFRRRGWLPLGAILSAAIFILGASASSRLQHTGMILSYSFFPWALWALEMALAKRSYLYGFVFGVFAALMAQGRDQVAYLFCLWLIAALVYEVFRTPHWFTYLRRRIGLILFMGGVGAILLAIPILLTLQFLGQSNRPNIAFGVAAEGSLSLVNFITLAVPNFFGSLDWNYDYWGPGYETITRGDWTDRAINYLFIGTIPTILLVWHGIAGRRLADPAIRMFAAVLIFTIVYAIGRFSPLFEIIFDHLPGVSLYRRPADATFALQFCLGIVSGYLANQALMHGAPVLSGTSSRNLLLISSAGLVTALVVAALLFSYKQNHLAHSVAALALTTAFGAVAVCALLKISNRTLAMMALIFLGCVELLVRDGASSLNSEPTNIYAPYATLKPEFKTGLDLLQAEIAKSHSNGTYPRVEVLGMNGPWMNASMVFGFENTVGYNPLRISDYERIVGPGDNSGDVSLRHFPANFRGYSSTLAKMLGLEYVMLDRPLPKLPRHFPRPIASLIYSTEGMYIYKLRPSIPRAYFAINAKSVDSEAIIDGDAIPDFDHDHEVLIDENSPEKLIRTYSAGVTTTSANSTVAIKTMRANYSVIEVETDQAGLLVLHDIYYPGWRASIDGTPTPIYRANILFRAIEMPKGKHTVRFEYAPFSKENLVSALKSLIKTAE